MEEGTNVLDRPREVAGILLQEVDVEGRRDGLELGLGRCGPRAGERGRGGKERWSAIARTEGEGERRVEVTNVIELLDRLLEDGAGRAVVQTLLRVERAHLYRG